MWGLSAIQCYHLLHPDFVNRLPLDFDGRSPSDWLDNETDEEELYEEDTLGGLSDSQIKDLKAAFCLLDKNQDGRVNASEIKCMLDSLGILLSDDMIHKLIQEACRRDDELISEDEFLTWMSKQTGLADDDIMEDLLAAFRVFDKDGNGYITKDELSTAMEMIGEAVSESQLEDMLKATDLDNDGRINYEEFVKILI